MIVVKLKGGLGNQMFQYAAARRIAYDNNLPLKIDKELGFKNDFFKRSYRLFNYNIIEDFINKNDLIHLGRKKTDKFLVKVYWFLDYVNPRFKKYEITHRSYQFDNDILRKYDIAYLNGHWESEKYFESIEEIIRKEFTLKYDLDSKSINILEKIKSCNSVSIHLRVLHGISGNKTNKNSRETHGMLEGSYYLEAMDFINQRIEDVHYFIFADSHNNSNQLIGKIKNSTVIYGNEDYIDLILMSKCKHNIIANSTFSWWAAWLNRNENKVIICPRKWFNKSTIDTTDLINKDWQQL
ncbi:MAG: alpha-1,2-fucosyltransferase [Melioribacteraceae bacterium]|nr:alpha-1,2-fucosyltransferase [Melioribacteraceae bacterium]